MFKRVSDPAFDMDTPVLKDESVRDYQYHSYEARDPTQRGRIELRVQNTSRYFLPAEAFLEVTGEIVTDVAANTPYGDNARVAFVNNGIIALFRSASYNIDGKEIKIIQDNVDVATTIIGLTRYSDVYTRSAGPTMMFAKDNSDHPEHRPNITVQTARDTAADPQAAEFAPRPGAAFSILRPSPEHNPGFRLRKSMLSGNRRRFSCAIPLSRIFGFCSGVRKVIFGANHTVVLHQKGDDNDAIWREEGVAAGKVILSKLNASNVTIDR